MKDSENFCFSLQFVTSSVVIKDSALDVEVCDYGMIIVLSCCLSDNADLIRRTGHSLLYTSITNVVTLHNSVQIHFKLYANRDLL